MCRASDAAPPPCRRADVLHSADRGGTVSPLRLATYLVLAVLPSSSSRPGPYPPRAECARLPLMSERLSPHFSDVEFTDWRHGHVWQTPTSRARYVELATRTLEPLRAELGRSVSIVSGERRESKTAANSRHMPPELRPSVRERGKPDGSPDAAADIRSGGVTPLDLALLVLRLMAQRVIPVGGVGLYPGFVHVDNRGRLASWRGSGVDDASFARFRGAVVDCATCIRISMEVSTDD